MPFELEPTDIQRYCGRCRTTHIYRNGKCMSHCKREKAWQKTTRSKLAEQSRRAGRSGLRKAKRKLLGDNPFCAYCGAKVSESTCDLDHITPVTSGGTDTDGNLQLLCKPCHAVKIQHEAHAARQRSQEQKG